jgi:hypothetical protein
VTRDAPITSTHLTGPAVTDPTTFYIIGCQRSGTTLMRLVLECHSLIQCCDEKTTYAVIAGRESLARERPIVGFKAPCLTEQFANPSWWDVLVLPEVRNEYCGQKLIFMVRDARDTVASMLRLRVLGQPWLDVHLMPSLEAKLERDLRFAERYGSSLARLRDARYRALAHAALYWRYKVDALVEYLELRFPVLLVRYEDLVAEPQVELLRVCGFLQVPWESGLLRHAAFTHTDVDDDGRATGDTDPRRPIDSDSVGQWRTSFTADQAQEILDFAGPVQASLYPTLTH